MVIGKLGLLATKLGLVFVVVAVAIYVVHPAQIFGNPAPFQGPEGGSGQTKTPSGSPSSDDSGSSGNAELSPPNSPEIPKPQVVPNQLSPPSPNAPLSGNLAGQSYDNGGPSGGGGGGSESDNTPVMTPIPAQSVNQTELLIFTISASDPKGKTLTYRADNIPVNASFNNETHVFSWVPLTSQVGLYIVNFSVSNGLLGASEDARIIVYAHGNHPPVWTITPDQYVNETELLSFQVNATDPDGDPITYGARNVPANATFNASTQFFTWVPSRGQAEEYNVTFTASDGILQTDMNVEITVNQAGPTPVPEFPLPGVPVAILAAVALMISIFKAKKTGK